MILCLYAYYEKDESYKRNCEYFIKHGVNEHADFVFVVNGKHTVQFPPNVKVIERENSGYDFGAHTAALNSTANLEQYSHFIFVNSSVKGPYTANLNQPWQHVLTSMIKGDTKLVGTTINVMMDVHETHRAYLNQNGFKAPFSHVQTQVFAMDRECLTYLRDLVFVDQGGYSFRDIIYKKEIALSQHVLAKGWNINCLAPKYRDIDYRKLLKDFNATSANGDANFPGSYFGGTLTPHEIMFVKTNREFVIEFFDDGSVNYCVPLVMLIGVVLITWYLKRDK